MKREFICKTCNIVFSPKYHISKNQTLEYCSKSCASKYIRQSKLNKSQLELDIKKIIKSKDTYLTKVEICNLLKMSSRTLSIHKISTKSLNQELGYFKSASIFEDRVRRILSLRYSDIQLEYTFSDCLSPKGHKLRFDFYIPSLNLIIEADGEQHIREDSYMPYPKEHDRIKEEYLELNNINLIRIPYTKLVTEKYINKFLEV